MPKLELEVHYPDRSPRRFPAHFGVYTIGADENNKIILPGKDVAWRHAVLTLMEDESYIEDLMSKSGTFVNGVRVPDRKRIYLGDTMRIGHYELLVVDADVAPAEQAAPPPKPKPEPPVEAPPKVGRQDLASQRMQTAKPSGVRRDAAVVEIKRQIQQELFRRLDLRRMTIQQLAEDELQGRIRATLEGVIKEVTHRLPAGLDPEQLCKELYDEAVGLGPLEDLLDDPEVTEIMVNGPDSVYVERGGKLTRTERSFLDSESVMAIIERIVSPIGRRIDESQPYVDARLPNGSRVNAIVPPLSLSGPCITIRVFSKIPFTVEDLCRMGTMPREVAAFIEVAVKLRKNIIVSGGTGSGKTTLLNVLSNFLPHDERIVTIEDAAELRLTQEHVVRLEARPPNIEGKGAITIRDLVRNALRMRPDRIVVGECRGGEALDMLQAMNTGHEGSLTTIHANSPRDSLARLETMVLMAGMDLPMRAIREQIASAIHMIVHISRFPDGSRRLARVTEVAGLEGDKITTQDLFDFSQTGVGPEGQVLGSIAPTGAVPTFTDEMRTRGIEFDTRIFDRDQWQP